MSLFISPSVCPFICLLFPAFWLVILIGLVLLVGYCKYSTGSNQALSGQDIGGVRDIDYRTLIVLASSNQVSYCT
jgi:hypothetical protein